MRISYNSPVILTLTLVCAAILFLDGVLAGNLTGNFFTVYPTFSFLNPLDYLRLFSHALGHANWTHLLSNFTFILLIGPILEEKYGSKPLLVMMFVTAFVTGVLNVLFFSTGLLGASGIVFMLIILSSITNIRQGEIPLTFILISVLFLGKEVVDAFNADNVSQFAHVIGGVCGGIFGLKFAKA
jgi:membrane associated rhomboid family serine protease